jgi:adenylate kinase family enzyme
MSNFTFETLNDKDFEILSTDIISKLESVNVDRFKPGKDQGVDGRFFSDGEEVVIQVKHYLVSGFSKMLYNCKNTESPKVKLLNPKRYIFICSLPLNRLQKSKLKDAFSPYLKEEDIYGQENLNDQLELNPEIIKKHYKLWLTSSSVLDKLINNATFNHSKFTLDDIQSFSKFYIKTKNHTRAMEVLGTTHCLVVSGQPGVGKTTLAQHICLELVGNDFEFVEIEEDINEGFQSYQKGKKQVFYFDDFLGSNYLDSIQRKESSSIVKFFKAIKKDKDKRFILTSRSSILNQTKNLTELFARSSFERNEYELNINSLSKMDKAHILYNRLYFSDMKSEYLDIIYQGKKYREIIDHKNYNPRLIEFITTNERYNDLKPQEYWEFVIENLNNPKNIWKFAIDSQLEEYERILVYIVAFHGNKDSLDEEYLEKIAAKYFKDTKYHITDKTFGYAIQTLSGSFLNRTVYEDKSTGLTLFNPSIADYLFSNFRKEKDTFSKIIYLSQSITSLDSLDKIRSSSLISNKLYSSILKNIIDKISLHQGYEKNKHFAVKALGNYCSLNAVDTVEPLLIDQFINDISINTIEFPIMEDYIFLLKFLINESLDKFDCFYWPSLFSNLFSKFLSHEELLVIAEFIYELKFSTEIDTTSIKHTFEKAVIEYWTEEIHDDVDENIEDCSFESIKDEANKHIRSVLSQYDLELESLSDQLIDCVDIDEIYTGMVERYSGEAHDFSNDDTNESPDAFDKIDDLFDRVSI